MLFVFHTLAVTACLLRYLQETTDLAQAVEYKNAVIDSLKEKHNVATAADVHAKTMVLCESNQILAQDHAFQKCKVKQMEEYVVASACGAGSEVSSASRFKDLI